MAFQPYIFIIYAPATDVFATADEPPPDSGDYVKGSGAQWHVVGSATTDAQAEEYIASLRQTYDGWGGPGYVAPDFGID
jgi:hypothetical protein